MATAIKHPVPDWVKSSFVIFDIQTLTLSHEVYYWSYVGNSEMSDQSSAQPLLCVDSRGSDAVGQCYGEGTFCQRQAAGGEHATVEPRVTDLLPAPGAVEAAGRP